MGEVHYLPTARESAARRLERAVGEAIARHPDPAVGERWAAMARETIARWPGPPLPTHARLELDTDGSLEPAVRAHLLATLERWFESYVEDVRVQMMAMHAELFTLQRRVAELEVAREGGAEPDETN